MAHASSYLAFDLGAESGRAVLGHYDGERISLSTLHRFPNGPVKVFHSLYWDVLSLFREIKTALSLYRHTHGRQLDGIGLDTWGVDFALLGRDDKLLGNPRHYRDPRTEGMLGAAFERVTRDEIFEQTGVQFMEINTLYQLLAMQLDDDPTLDRADALLMIPDLFNFWLTGIKTCEFTAATTSQFYDPRRGDWARALLQKLDLPTRILQNVTEPGTMLGPLHPAVADEIGLGNITVIAPSCHDTGSAVAAVPATSESSAYISSGTWSLMGVETPKPVISDDSLRYNFTNEGGVCNTFRLLKNIMGLWIVQECRRVWAQGAQQLSYGEITALATAAAPFVSIIEPDDHDFLRPDDMPARIRSFCGRTGQRQPETKGEIIRCTLESLAFKYRWVLEKLERLLDRHLETIHVVGGGSQNQLLCQFTADATGRPVIAGPVEATALGNILMQALARGHISSLSEGREIVRRSFDLKSYEPNTSGGWDEAYSRFLAIKEQVDQA